MVVVDKNKVIIANADLHPPVPPTVITTEINNLFLGTVTMKKYFKNEVIMEHQ